MRLVGFGLERNGWVLSIALGFIISRNLIVLSAERLLAEVECTGRSMKSKGRDAKSNKNSRDKFLAKKISTKKWPKNDPK